MQVSVRIHEFSRRAQASLLQVSNLLSKMRQGTMKNPDVEPPSFIDGFLIVVMMSLRALSRTKLRYQQT
jgi:hypothetical protein